jgi:hypothetical protein
MSGSNPFDFSELLNGLVKKDNISDIAKIAEQQENRKLKEDNAAMKAELERLRELIIRCPKCGAKLKVPKI